MANFFFSGANTGRGFVSRFSGIVPPGDTAHYTYILKGGPGVGKNTLMRTVADRATAMGHAVEEFRCASDPDSLDAVRVPALGIVLLDGTAPHGMDPVLPGIEGEIFDLGRFQNQAEFRTHRAELERLQAESRAHYAAAYAMLGAARLLKMQAVSVTRAAMRADALAAFLREVFGDAAAGKPRALFARSATPKGVLCYADTYLPPETTFVSGAVGAAILGAAGEYCTEKSVEIGYDFIDPDLPYTVACAGRAMAIREDGDRMETLLQCALPPYVDCFLAQAEALAIAATEEIANAHAVHDEIEKIYRPYVDYARLQREKEELLQKIYVI